MLVLYKKGCLDDIFFYTLQHSCKGPYKIAEVQCSSDIRLDCVFQVKLWATVNEPNMYCIYFPTLYNVSGLYTDSDLQRYDCVRHTILAHAEAYHVFKEDNHEGNNRGRKNYTVKNVFVT